MAAQIVKPAATVVDLALIKGDSFDWVFPVRDRLNAEVVVDGWTAKAQVRRSEDEPVLHEWSAAEGNIAVSGSDVVLTVDGAVTSAWGWTNAHISVEVTNLQGRPNTIAYGVIRALPEYTQ